MRFRQNAETILNDHCFSIEKEEFEEKKQKDFGALVFIDVNRNIAKRQNFHRSSSYKNASLSVKDICYWYKGRGLRSLNGRREDGGAHVFLCCETKHKERDENVKMLC